MGTRWCGFLKVLSGSRWHRNFPSEEEGLLFHIWHRTLVSIFLSLSSYRGSEREALLA